MSICAAHHVNCPTCTCMKPAPSLDKTFSLIDENKQLKEDIRQLVEALEESAKLIGNNNPINHFKMVRVKSSFLRVIRKHKEKTE